MEKKGVERSDLKKSIVELFDGDSEIALFYFSGHGHIETHGGFICSSDNKNGDEGIALFEIMQIATLSVAKNIIIILDSCYSGGFAENSIFSEVSEIKSGMVILAACTSSQVADEDSIASRGIFTTLLIEALEGSAANLVGEISASSAYAHIDQSLGNWKQRPVFKANVNSLVPLRKIVPQISKDDLRLISTLFSTNEEIELDPTFVSNTEQGRFDFHKTPTPDSKNVEKYRILNELIKMNLVETDDGELFITAMYNRTCKLTKLGKHYLNLVKNNQI